MTISPIMIRAILELADYCHFTKDAAHFERMMQSTLWEILAMAFLKLEADKLLADFDRDRPQQRTLADDLEDMIAMAAWHTVQ